MIVFDCSRIAKALAVLALAFMMALSGSAARANEPVSAVVPALTETGHPEVISAPALRQLQRAGQFDAEKAAREAARLQASLRSIFDEGHAGTLPIPPAPAEPMTLEEAARNMEESGSLRRNVLTRDKAGHRVHPKHPGKAWDWFMEKRVPQGERRLPDFYRHEALLETYRHNMDRDSLREESRAAAWTSIAPSGAVQPSGRMVEIAVHPTNDQIIYGASASGGLWKTTNRGGQWVNVTDGWIPTLGMGSVAIDPFNPETVYCGLGEGVPGGTYEPFGAGIYRSSNGGASWALLPGTENFRYVTDLEVSVNSQTILAAVKGLSDGSGGGLYITQNGGDSWFTSAGTFQNLSFFDISVDSINRNNVLATKGQTSNASFTDFGAIYYSSNGGATFVETFPGSTGISNNNVNRLELARGPGGRVFAIAGGSDSSLLGLLGSDDGGLTWGLPALGGVPPAGQQYSPGQMTYNLTIAVSPTNPNVVYFGSNLRMFRSFDSGNNFAFVADWAGDDGLPYVHADHHCIRFGATDQTVYCANDGGFFYSLNGGATWTEANHGYAANQIYRIDNNRTNENVIIYGCQDNDKYLRRADGTWRHYPNTFGDGMDMIAYDPDPNTLLGTNQLGNVIGLTQNGGDNWAYIRTVGDGSSGIPGDERGHWLSPLINDTQNPNLLFFGLHNIWRATYTPGFVPQWSLFVTVPAQFPVVGLMEHLAITAGPEPRKLVGFFGRANQVQGGVFFEVFNINLDGSGIIQEFPLPATSGWVNALETDPNDKNAIWIGYSNLNSSQVAVTPRIYRSPNLGQTWVDMTNNFPRNLPVSAIFVDPQNSNTVIVGSDVGVYRSDNGGQSWAYWSDGLPPVVISDFAYYPPTRKLRAATYGRGAWETPLSQTTGGAELSNISTRGLVGEADSIMIAGITVTGGPKTVLINGRGPDLSFFGVPNVLPDPTLTLFQGANAIENNNDWMQAANSADIAAHPNGPANFPSPSPLTASILTTLQPGSYTVHLVNNGSLGGGSRNGLIEVWLAEANPGNGGPDQLSNISTRGLVGEADSIMIAGVTVTGGAKRVLINGRGPDLSSFGVPNVLPDPTLTLFQGSTPIASNNDWMAADNSSEIGAHPNGPAGFPSPSPFTASILTTLQPGSYTVHLVNNGPLGGVSRNGLIEVWLAEASGREAADDFATETATTLDAAETKIAPTPPAKPRWLDSAEAIAASPASPAMVRWTTPGRAERAFEVYRAAWNARTEAWELAQEPLDGSALVRSHHPEKDQTLWEIVDPVASRDSETVYFIVVEPSESEAGESALHGPLAIRREESN
jgi:photosystem II stability/assembly factor-like uncharacterized protein